MKEEYPAITIADITTLILLIFSAIFLYTWDIGGNTGYLVLGIIEFILAITQYKINRTDIVF